MAVPPAGSVDIALGKVSQRRVTHGVCLLAPDPDMLNLSPCASVHTYDTASCMTLMMTSLVACCHVHYEHLVRP